MYILCASAGDSQTCKAWLASVERRRCNNKAKTRNTLKFAGVRVPQTGKQISAERISAVSRPKFVILCGHVEEILLFMAALRTIFEHYIFVLWFLSSFFPRLILLVADRMSAILLYTWCSPSANLECRSEMCCTCLLETQEPKTCQKIAICAPSHNFVGYIFPTKACIDNQKETR